MVDPEMWRQKCFHHFFLHRGNFMTSQVLVSVFCTCGDVEVAAGFVVKKIVFTTSLGSVWQGQTYSHFVSFFNLKGSCVIPDFKFCGELLSFALAGDPRGLPFCDENETHHIFRSRHGSPICSETFPSKRLQKVRSLQERWKGPQSTSGCNLPGQERP